MLQANDDKVTRHKLTSAQFYGVLNLQTLCQETPVRKTREEIEAFWCTSRPVFSTVRTPSKSVCSLMSTCLDAITKSHESHGGKWWA